MSPEEKPVASPPARPASRMSPIGWTLILLVMVGAIAAAFNGVSEGVIIPAMIFALCVAMAVGQRPVQP